MSREVLIGFRKKDNLIVRGSDNLVKTSGVQRVHVHPKERVGKTGQTMIMRRGDYK